jgi:hypothetical protein
MSGARNEAQEAKVTPQPHAADTLYGRDDAEDATTLKFDGPVAVSDEDAGSDPYNRTGRFRRLVRG